MHSRETISVGLRQSVRISTPATSLSLASFSYGPADFRRTDVFVPMLVLVTGLPGASTLPMTTTILRVRLDWSRIPRTPYRPGTENIPQVIFTMIGDLTTIATEDIATRRGTDMGQVRQADQFRTRIHTMATTCTLQTIPTRTTTTTPPLPLPLAQPRRLRRRIILPRMCEAATRQLSPRAIASTTRTPPPPRTRLGPPA